MYSENFSKAIEIVLKHEGGYNDVVGDAGGATNYGVTLTTITSLKKDLNHDGRIDKLDIKSMSKEQAIDIYWDCYWKASYDALPIKTCVKLFDTAVNTGNNQAHKFLQRALNNLGSKLDDDGIIGQGTIAEVKKYADIDIVKQFGAEQLEFYKGLVAKKPILKKFLAGWTNRANEIPNV